MHSTAQSIEKGPNCDVEKVTRMIATFIPSIRVDRNVGTELTYRLKSEYVQSYENMLKALESRTEELHILGYGISQTSLEDVFMQIVSQNSAEDETAEDMGRLQVPRGKLMPNTGVARIGNQLHAMLYKRFFVACRNWQLLLVQNTIPIALTSITVYIARQIKINKVLPPLPIDLDEYHIHPITLLCVDSAIVNPEMKWIEANYRSSFGTGRECKNLNFLGSGYRIRFGVRIPLYYFGRSSGCH